MRLRQLRRGVDHHPRHQPGLQIRGHGHKTLHARILHTVAPRALHQPPVRHAPAALPDYPCCFSIPIHRTPVPRTMQQEQAPTRSLPLAGATNFRDLGGYTGQGGRPVKWRRIFRSDHLAALTPEDQALLAQLGVARAVDFRGKAESAAYAYALPGIAYHPLAIEPTVVQRALELQRTGRQLTAQDAVGLMQDTYRGFVHDNAPRF
eukprot:gene8209-10446_t